MIFYFQLLPFEIIHKIYMYSHPVLRRDLKYSIINYKFIPKNIKKLHRNSRYCYNCLRYHTIPRHFSCNYSHNF